MELITKVKQIKDLKNSIQDDIHNTLNSWDTGSYEDVYNLLTNDSKKLILELTYLILDVDNNEKLANSDSEDIGDEAAELSKVRFNAFIFSLLRIKPFEVNKYINISSINDFIKRKSNDFSQNVFSVYYNYFMESDIENEFEYEFKSDTIYKGDFYPIPNITSTDCNITKWFNGDVVIIEDNKDVDVKLFFKGEDLFNINLSIQ